MQNDYLEKLNREDIKLASNSKRILAFIIDELLLSIIFVLMIGNKIEANASYEEILNTVASVAYYLLFVKFIYQALFIWLYSATIGKIILKIYVINIEDLEKPNIFLSVVRSIVRLINESFMFYFGYLLAFISPLRQTIQDKLAKTIVVDV